MMLKKEKLIIILSMILVMNFIVGVKTPVFATNNTTDSTTTNTTTNTATNTTTNTTTNSTTTNTATNTTTTTTAKKSIKKLTLTVDTSIKSYTGEKLQPTVKLYDGKVKLKLNTDYTVKYENNKKPGKAKITISGKGNYTGTITKYFFIAPKKATIKSVFFNSKATKATITWAKDKLATGYRIYMSETKNGEYTRIKTISDNKTVEFTKKGLDPNKTYYFKVRAYIEVDGKKKDKEFSAAKTDTGLLGKVSLTSSSSGANRNWNLKLASKKINGTVLKPGDTFNWFNVVGRASKANGYKLASVYSNGKTVQGYGGGVCQVSTTLYQAALKADLKIVERHMHSKSVTYTEWGKDATVSYGSLNLRIKNNKKYSIKMVTYSDKTKSTCELYKVID